MVELSTFSLVGRVVDIYDEVMTDSNEMTVLVLALGNKRGSFDNVPIEFWHKARGLIEDVEEGDHVGITGRIAASEFYTPRGELVRRSRLIGCIVSASNGQDHMDDEGEG